MNNNAKLSEQEARDIYVDNLKTLSNPLDFSKKFHSVRENRPFVEGPHHQILSQTLSRLGRDITRLIINVPPGYSKTTMVIIDQISRQIALDPSARFITVSFAQSRALESSAVIRETINSAEYQAIREVVFTDDRRAKGLWRTAQGGGLLAVSTGGQVTGFHAGNMEGSDIEFDMALWYAGEQQSSSGGLYIDDPLKPGDALSDAQRNRVNMQFLNTLRSRIVSERTPICIIMQRLDTNDLTGFLLRGGSPVDKWHHLVLPIMINNASEYPVNDYTHGIQVKYDLPDGPLWPAKHSQERINQMALGNESIFAAQYMQSPLGTAGSVFRSHWWKYYERYDAANGEIVKTDGTRVTVRFKNIYADTALKTGVLNDYTVIQCWACGADGNAYLLDQKRGKYEVPDLESEYMEFLGRHKFIAGVNSIGIRGQYIEDKASGIGLIQALNRGGARITGIPRDKEKASRALSAAPHIASGQVWLPVSAQWLPEFLGEASAFAVDMSHRHDDQIDPMMDAISDILGSQKLKSFIGAIR